MVPNVKLTEAAIKQPEQSISPKDKLSIVANYGLCSFVLGRSLCVFNPIRFL